MAFVLSLWLYLRITIAMSRGLAWCGSLHDMLVQTPLDLSCDTVVVCSSRRMLALLIRPGVCGVKKKKKSQSSWLGLPAPPLKRSRTWSSLSLPCLWFLLLAALAVMVVASMILCRLNPAASNKGAAVLSPTKSWYFLLDLEDN